MRRRAPNTNVQSATLRNGERPMWSLLLSCGHSAVVPALEAAGHGFRVPRLVPCRICAKNRGACADDRRRLP